MKDPQRPLKLTKSDIRFLEWLASFLAGAGVSNKKFYPIIGKLARYGLVEQDGNCVFMTGVGWHALIASGFEPQTLDGLTLADLTRKSAR